MRRSKPALKNRILTVAGAVLLVALSVFSIQKTFVSAVALEQTARCGAQEHHHETDCYADGKLTCGQREHTHNRNCYLVLLKDNDINNLLSHIDNDQSHSLEMLIYRTVDTAIHYNSDLAVVDADTNSGVGTVFLSNTAVSASAQGETLTEAEMQTAATQVEYSSVPAAVSMQAIDISALNETISENEIEPNIVLNEDLYDATVLSGTPTDTVALLGDVSSSGGISTLSVGDTPETGTNNANFYVYLDGSWQCIGTLDFSVVQSGSNWNRRYTAQISTANVVNLINDSLGTEFSYDNFELIYATSANAGSASWSDAGISSTLVTFGSSSRQDTARQAKYVRVIDDAGDEIAFYTVTYIYPDGSNDYEYVQTGSTVILPNGYDWRANGNTYTGGESVTISGATTFTAAEQITDGSIRVAYDVNFPTSVTGFSNTVYMPTSPTLMGTSATTARDTVEENGGTVVRDISDREIAAETAHQASFFYVFYFNGWLAESGNVIDPNTHLPWQTLQAYDVNGDGIVSLEGQWRHSTATVANFCVRYDSKTGQSDTSSSKYTDSIHSTYVGGGGDLALEGITDNEAYLVDQQIRALYGNWSGDVWLYSFPSDEYVFEQLKNYTARLTVEDEEVNAADLNSTQYAIRWYKIFEDGSDGWHIDGRLVKKKGQITVDKEFFGNADTVALAKDGFYITAANSAGTKQYILTMDEATANSLASQYPNASFLISSNNKWLIEDVELGEVWNIEEHPVSVNGNMYYAEYSVYDTDGNTTALAEYGTSATLTGKTFALDEDPDQGLLVDFRNYYYPTESILIKKEDADTGQPIGGAAFELWQYNSEGELSQLKFTYDADTGQYRYDNNGNITRVTTGSAGYTTITTTGFSYEHGDVVVKEVISPTGYAAAPNITLSESGGSVSITDMAYEDGTEVDSAQWPDYAEVYDDGSALIVKNHSTALTSVTANKVWADEVTADSVTVVLQANNSTATNLFPGLSGIRAVLSAENGWQYTWTDLPTYANGAQVRWSVKEILVGDEATTSDGVSFANWTVVYSQPVQTDANGDGVTDHWNCTITNSARRAQLFLKKTNSDNIALSGAVFELVEVDNAGNPVSGAIVHTGATGDDGLLQFDNLKYATRYRLVETAPPSGHEGYTIPAYLSLALDGTVTVDPHSHVTAGSYVYMVQVVNHTPLPLPTTGGSGPGVSYGFGGALLLLAACGYILLKTQKRGRRQSG